MQSRVYNFSTAQKRSTLLETKAIQFPRQQQGSPRMKILKKECGDLYKQYHQCTKVNQNNISLCTGIKSDLFDCGKPAYKKINLDVNYRY